MEFYRYWQCNCGKFFDSVMNCLSMQCPCCFNQMKPVRSNIFIEMFLAEYENPLNNVTIPDSVLVKDGEIVDG